MKTRAPGKLILSGEHAVVHGRPALVTAVNRYAETTLTPREDGIVHVDFPPFRRDACIPMAELPAFRQKADRNYAEFLEGERPIRRVLDHPVELLYYTVARVMEERGSPCASGCRIALRSDLPMGCGMGASAAVIVSVLGACLRQAGVNAAADDVFHRAWDIEKLQHGRPSGVDPYISVHGGLVRFREGRADPVETVPMKLYLVHTGAPESTTGECVMDVARRWNDHSVWDEFERVVLELEEAMKNADTGRMRRAVRENHRLLCRIGVVPHRVQSFIRELEGEGAAAKICGAGSISGEAGGMVWALCDEAPEALCRRFEYDLMSVEPEPRGWQVLDEGGSSKGNE